MNLFKRKTSELDKLILEFLKGGGMKKFIEDQAKSNQNNILFNGKSKEIKCVKKDMIT